MVILVVSLLLARTSSPPPHPSRAPVVARGPAEEGVRQLLSLASGGHLLVHGLVYQGPLALFYGPDEVWSSLRATEIHDVRVLAPAERAVESGAAGEARGAPTSPRDGARGPAASGERRESRLSHPLRVPGGRGTFSVMGATPPRSPSSPRSDEVQSPETRGGGDEKEDAAFRARALRLLERLQNARIDVRALEQELQASDGRVPSGLLAEDSKTRSRRLVRESGRTGAIGLRLDKARARVQAAEQELVALRDEARKKGIAPSVVR